MLNTCLRALLKMGSTVSWESFDASNLLDALAKDISNSQPPTRFDCMGLSKSSFCTLMGPLVFPDFGVIVYLHLRVWFLATVHIGTSEFWCFWGCWLLENLANRCFHAGWSP